MWPARQQTFSLSLSLPFHQHFGCQIPFPLQEHFRCPGLLNWLNNQMLLGQLLGMDHVLMDFSATPADS
jgi:hypothetical protein